MGVNARQVQESELSSVSQKQGNNHKVELMYVHTLTQSHGQRGFSTPVSNRCLILCFGGACDYADDARGPRRANV